MQVMPGYVTIAPTDAPDVGEQVASDLVEQVSTAAETASDVVEKLPIITSRLLLSAAVLVGCLILLKVGKWLIGRLARRNAARGDTAQQRAKTWQSLIGSIYTYLMVFVMVTIILRLFDVDITSIMAAAGVVGIAVAFGAQTLVKDILSGLFIWGEGSMAVGDLVSINDLDGTVESMTIRTTSIRNYNGNLVIIPNGDIRTMTNMSKDFKRAIVSVPCPYEENQERLVAMIREEMEKAVGEIDGLESLPEIMSIVSFDTHAVMLQIAAPCPVGQHWRIERDIRTRIKARFDREGIMMPHYSLPKGK